MESLTRQINLLRSAIKEVDRDIEGMRRVEKSPKMENLLEQAAEYRKMLEEDLARLERKLPKCAVVAVVIPVYLN